MLANKTSLLFGLGTAQRTLNKACGKSKIKYILRICKKSTSVEKRALSDQWIREKNKNFVNFAFQLNQLCSHSIL